jgi:hypothetical protein
MTEGGRRRVPRRVVVGGLAAAVLPVAGCGIRLEDDAPRVPLVPTRTPVPAEAELVALTRGTAALAAKAATVPGALGAALTGIHRHQLTVLRTTLLSAGVPATALDAVPSPSASPAPSPTASPAAARAALARAEGASAAAAASFAGVQADLRATVAALHAQRFAAAELLTGRPPTVPDEPVSGEQVRALAGGTAAAAYFLEVVAARSSGAQRARADATLAALRGLLADQVAGGSQPEVPLGHPLPFPVDDAAAAARLARQALTTLRAGYGEQLAPVVATSGGAGLTALTRWLGTVEVQAHRWGVELAPFPGLT